MNLHKSVCGKTEAGVEARHYQEICTNDCLESQVWEGPASLRKTLRCLTGTNETRLVASRFPSGAVQVRPSSFAV